MPGGNRLRPAKGMTTEAVHEEVRTLHQAAAENHHLRIDDADKRADSQRQIIRGLLQCLDGSSIAGASCGNHSFRGIHPGPARDRWTGGLSLPSAASDVIRFPLAAYHHPA